MRRPLIVVVIVVAAIGVYALFLNRGHADEAGGPVPMSSPLPALEGPAVSGGMIDLADYRGNVTVLNVWATWCGPCSREQPALTRVAEAYADRGVRFVGLNYQDNRAAARAWVEEYGVPYDSLFDENGRFADDLGFPYLPDTYIVDIDGTIRWAIYGETNEAEVSGLLDDLVSESPATEA